MEEEITMMGVLSIKNKYIKTKTPVLNAETVEKETEADAAEAAVESKLSLLDAEPGRTYVIKQIDTEDEEMNSFLFRLGCYSGEPITLISKKRNSCIVVIKDGRYNLDSLLSKAIII